MVVVAITASSSSSNRDEGGWEKDPVIITVPTADGTVDSAPPGSRPNPEDRFE